MNEKTETLQRNNAGGDDKKNKKKTERFVFIRLEDIGFERTTFVLCSGTPLTTVTREDEKTRCHLTPPPPSTR